jgi:ArsR family transcriptional regulator
MADIFDVVADATRRELLQVLLERYMAPEPASGDISVGELVEKLGLSQPTVSKHLKVLRDSGMVSVREDGQHRYYRLDSGPLEVIEDWLIPFLSADFDTTDEDAPASAVFAAWSGGQLPAPLRRAGESLQHPGETGTAVGRAVADATHNARHALEGASEQVTHRVIEPLRKKLKKG